MEVLLQNGAQFGEYTVLEEIGRGAMAAVYHLHHPSGVERAAKILLPSVAKRNPIYLERFLNEARFALGVEHPNLVTVRDCGRDPITGLCYIIMDLVTGGTLRQRLDTFGPFPIDDAVRIVLGIASALVVAARVNVVHRDIKPANIMFTTDGTAKLVDLGVAKFPAQGTSPALTSNVIIGTPAYMPPEQSGDSHSVDSRADIYSLGIVFYEMLAGRRPFTGAKERIAKAYQIPDVRTFRRDVPAPIAQLINAMCQPDLNRRIATPNEVVDIFNRIFQRRRRELHDQLVAIHRLKMEELAREQKRKRSVRRRRFVLQFLITLIALFTFAIHTAFCYLLALCVIGLVKLDYSNLHLPHYMPSVHITPSTPRNANPDKPLNYLIED